MTAMAQPLGNPTLKGDAYRRAHKFSVIAILGDRAPHVASRGSRFYNMDRWTVRVFVREMCKWAHANAGCIPTRKEIGVWVEAANRETVPFREIVIANTPRHLTTRVAMALTGGGYHEAWHTYYSCLRPLRLDEMANMVLPRWARVPDWSKFYMLLQDWNNIVEDVRIERLGCVEFPGAHTKMCDLQDFILHQEAQGLDNLRAHGNPKAKRGALSLITATFRDVGLGYNTLNQQGALAKYKADDPKAVEFVLDGPLSDLLRETIKLTKDDDIACVRIAMDVIGALYDNSSEEDPANDPDNPEHQPGQSHKTACPSCNAPGNKMVVRPKADGRGGKVPGKGILTCSVCGYQQEVDVQMQQPQQGAQAPPSKPEDTPRFEGFDPKDFPQSQGEGSGKSDDDDDSNDDADGDADDKDSKPSQGSSSKTDKTDDQDSDGDDSDDDGDDASAGGGAKDSGDDDSGDEDITGGGGADEDSDDGDDGDDGDDNSMGGADADDSDEDENAEGAGSDEGDDDSDNSGDEDSDEADEDPDEGDADKGDDADDDGDDGDDYDAGYEDGLKDGEAGTNTNFNDSKATDKEAYTKGYEEGKQDGEENAADGDDDGDEGDDGNDKGEGDDPDELKDPDEEINPADSTTQGADDGTDNQSNTDADADPHGGGAKGGGANYENAAHAGNDWSDLADQALEGAEDGTGLKDNNTALEEAVGVEQKKEDRQEGGVKTGEKAWRPYDPSADEYLMVGPSKHGKEKDGEKAARYYSSVKDEASFLRARLRQIVKALEMRDVIHGVPKGRRLSGRFLVDSKVALMAKQFPKRAYKVVDEALDTSLAAAIVIDESGSMGSLQRDATRVMIALTEPLDALNCPVQVSGFRNGYNHSQVNVTDGGNYHRFNSITHDVFKRFDEPYRAVKWRFANTRATGGTPMADGVQFGLDALNNRTEGHRVLFVITDGQPNGGHMPIMRRQFRLAKEAGIHVVGVGLGYGARYVQKVFVDSVWTAEIKDMPKALIAKLNELIDVRASKRGRRMRRAG